MCLCVTEGEAKQRKGKKKAEGERERDKEELEYTRDTQVLLLLSGGAAIPCLRQLQFPTHTPL